MTKVEKIIMAILIIAILGAAVFWRDIRNAYKNKQEKVSKEVKEDKKEKKMKKDKKDKKDKEDDEAKISPHPHQDSIFYYI